MINLKQCGRDWCGKRVWCKQVIHTPVIPFLGSLHSERFMLSPSLAVIWASFHPLRCPIFLHTQLAFSISEFPRSFLEISNGSTISWEILECYGIEETGIGLDLLDKPILAASVRHPNRYQDFAKKPNRMLKIKDKGTRWSSIEWLLWKLALKVYASCSARLPWESHVFGTVRQRSPRKRD